MKKKLIFAITMVLLLSVPLFAQDAEREAYYEKVYYGVYDNAGLLNDDEIDILDQLTEEIAEKYNFELIILTIDSIGDEDPVDFSWAILDKEGLTGENWDGCLLLRSKENRDYAFTVSGRGEKILNKAAYDKLEKDVTAYLKEDDYSGAFQVFISDWEKFLILEQQGKRYNSLRNLKTHLLWLLGAWALALLIGLGAVKSMIKKMNNVHPKTEADLYIIPNSMILTQQDDKFLYSTVTKTKRESSSGGGRSGGGRSSRSGRA